MISHLTTNMDVTTGVQGNVCIPQKWLLPAIWGDLMECVNLAWKVCLSCNHKHLHPFFFSFVREAQFGAEPLHYSWLAPAMQSCVQSPALLLVPRKHGCSGPFSFHLGEKTHASILTVSFFTVLHLHPKQQDTLNPWFTPWTTPLILISYTLREQFSSTREESKEHPLQRNI